jgi:hypothetical protein
MTCHRINQTNTPLDYGGTIVLGAFKPQYIIKREINFDWSEDVIVAMKKINTLPSLLYVYRLLDNGKSCVIGAVITNAEAREIAQRDTANPPCVD